MKKVDMTNVKESGSSNRLPAGAYICTIKDVDDIEDKEYLKVTYDISEGEYKGHFDTIRADHPDWAWVGAYVKSYKQRALPMFKRFCSSVSQSNGKYVFDGGMVNSDEKSLIGKKIGLILREEEYYTNSGDIRTRLIVHTEFPVSKIAEQRIPEVKKLPEEQKSSDDEFMNVPAGADGEFPF